MGHLGPLLGLPWAPLGHFGPLLGLPLGPLGIENEVPDLGHGRVGCWVPCLDEFVGFVLGFISLILYVGGSGGSGP